MTGFRTEQVLDMDMPSLHVFRFAELQMCIFVTLSFQRLITPHTKNKKTETQRHACFLRWEDCILLLWFKQSYCWPSVVHWSVKGISEALFSTTRSTVGGIILPLWQGEIVLAHHRDCKQRATASLTVRSSKNPRTLTAKANFVLFIDLLDSLVR